MTPPTLIIRASAEADIPAITTIYAHHVRHGLASFEEVPPEAAEMAQRRAALLEKDLPYLTAEFEGRVVGYAYAGLFRPRTAYRYTLEDSIYVAADAPRRGIGRALLSDLLARSAALGYRQMVAVIGDTGNTPSIALHAALGFRVVGTLPSVGFKFGRWVDSVFMQRPLGPGDTLKPGEPAKPG